MIGSLRRGSDGLVYMCVGDDYYTISSEEIQDMLYAGNPAHIKNGNNEIVGHAIASNLYCSVNFYTVFWELCTSMICFRRAVTGEARSTPLYPVGCR